ncbi:maleate cis-trans isomerase [Billgrantia saliphila]|uniref:aspartate racemase/maleate isomerase family protein n=1 Tax=Billgrantia saliphila TaxID=1848458 RepID=UPI000CE322AA|nr:maleate cis-trans isomerase [Halomonas saliphila]
MQNAQCLGILLPEDGPSDYEWYELNQRPGIGESLPTIEVGKVLSDGHHEHTALMSLGATDRLAAVGEGLVKEHGAQAVVWACTSGSFIGGLEWAFAQSRELSQWLGVPSTSTALAFRDALAALEYRRVDLLSPYPTEVTDQLVRFLGDSGVTVDGLQVLDCPYAADSHRLDIVASVRDFAMAHESGNPILVPDTAINTLERVEAMSRAAGRQVLTANQVSLWAGLRLLKRNGGPIRYLQALAEVSAPGA